MGRRSQGGAAESLSNKRPFDAGSAGGEAPIRGPPAVIRSERIFLLPWSSPVRVGAVVMRRCLHFFDVFVKKTHQRPLHIMCLWSTLFIY